MIVDDEYMILEGLKHIIPWNDMGFTIVYTAQRGKEALNYLTENSIDVLITDVAMPDMLGIELVGKINEKGLKIPTLILSGYQKFDYVKQGIDLGVKGYLVKPANKQELYEHLMQIKEELEEKKERKTQQHLVLKNTISRWLSDSLDQQEFDLLKDKLQISNCENFTVIVVRQYSDSHELNVFLKEKTRQLMTTYKKQDGQQIICIIVGNQTKVNLFIRELREKHTEKIYKIAVGNTVNTWEEVHKSLATANNLLLFDAFYEENRQTKLVLEVNFETDINKLNLISFNKALIFGDREKIKLELEGLFKQMKKLKFEPENVRYVTFLIFSDIYRQYPFISQDKYTNVLRKIQSSNSIFVLENMLKDILYSIRQKPNERYYSDAVQKVVDILKTRYQEDLSVQSIARELHLNSMYLGQLFKKETQLSFIQYLNHVRINKAQQLLLYSDLRIHEIADQIGYNNANYFAKCFRKINNLKPKEFREKYCQTYQTIE